MHFGTISHLAVSKAHAETETRAYFDGGFTSTTEDMMYRTIPETEFPTIINAFTTGLRVLDSHKSDNNGLGKTVAAAQADQIINGTFYIFKGMEIDGNFEKMRLDEQSYPDTLSWIMGLNDGMIDKCSMGWYSERDICNLCQEHIYSYKCRHYPGERFPITDEENGEENMNVCTYSCYGITPVELSLVYFPANPDARLVAKAKAMAESFSNEQIDRIESQLKTAIAPERSNFPMKLDKEAQDHVASIVAESLKPITEKLDAIGQSTPTPAVQTAAAPAITEDGSYNITDATGNVIMTVAGKDIPQAAKPMTHGDVSEAIKTAMGPMTETLTKIAQAVKSGDSLDERDTAITENIAQYNRIFGKKGDEVTHKAKLEAYPDVESIKYLTEAYKASADEMFTAGRSTEGALETIDQTLAKPETDPTLANPM